MENQSNSPSKKKMIIIKCSLQRPHLGSNFLRQCVVLLDPIRGLGAVIQHVQQHRVQTEVRGLHAAGDGAAGKWDGGGGAEKRKEKSELRKKAALKTICT